MPENVVVRVMLVLTMPGQITLTPTPCGASSARKQAESMATAALLVAPRRPRALLDQIAPDPPLSPAEQLHTVLERFTDYVVRNPRRYLAVVRYTTANRELRNSHSPVRAIFADWLLDGLGAAGVPANRPVRASVAGWLAFVEEALLTWLGAPQMPQDELVALCERACYAVIEAAVAAPSLWSEIRRRISERSADSAPSLWSEIRRRISERSADSACAPGTSA
jgi:hypothetical protein